MAYFIKASSLLAALAAFSCNSVSSALILAIYPSWTSFLVTVNWSKVAARLALQTALAFNTSISAEYSARIFPTTYRWLISSSLSAWMCSTSILSTLASKVLFVSCSSVIYLDRREFSAWSSSKSASAAEAAFNASTFTGISSAIESEINSEKSEISCPTDS